MLATMLAFFGVIIAVNVTMAVFAGSSWTGLVVENAYVASQQFNEQAAAGRAQAALGWTGKLTIDGAGVSYRLTDKAGDTIAMQGVTVKLRHPAYAAADRTLVLARSQDGAFATGERAPDGLWIVEVDADFGTATPYRDVRRLVVSKGAGQ
jgi:nitrogen fixation protein FixH